MNIEVRPFRARGGIEAPPSKSAAHRLLICAALSDRETIVRMKDTNADIEATVRCLEALGASFEKSGNEVTVRPVKPGRRESLPVLDCGESGSTLRFLMAVSSALGGARLTGRGRLPQRPIGELSGQIRAHGAFVSGDQLPLTVSDGLRGGEFSLPGNVSSQYFSGLMLAAPLIGETRLFIEGTLESSAYIDMTAQAMRLFSVETERLEGQILIPGGQRYKSPGRAETEGDWSGAAFPLALGALGGPVRVSGLREKTAQGDSRILQLLRRMGAMTETDGDGVTVSSGGRLRPIEEDVSGIPDLVPVLAALLMHAAGESRLLNAGRLRLKESDRLESTCAMVNGLGGDARIAQNCLVIRGKENAPGGTVRGYADHRIVMAGLVGASACLKKSTVTDGEAVRKSYPEFFRDIRELGGNGDVVSIRGEDQDIGLRPVPRA